MKERKKRRKGIEEIGKQLEKYIMLKFLKITLKIKGWKKYEDFLYVR